ncbi:MAG: nucleotidyltransferase domain-containing protein, partial [Janthinobacterium lividum]
MLSPLPLPDQPDDAMAILATSLGALSDTGQPPPRDAVLGVFRRYLTRLQHHVQQGFEEGGMSGLQAGRLLGRLTDGVILSLYNYARIHVAEVEAATVQEPISVVATGGYGRGVLAPFSDIDLLFITADAPGPRSLAAVEFMLYFLWDLGLKVGHATRSVDECIADAGRDLTVRTSMIDARLLAGDPALFGLFENRFLLFCNEAGAG